MKHPFARILLAMVLLVMLATVPVRSFAQADDRSTLRLGLNPLPRSLDPTFDTNAVSNVIYRLIYEPLVQIDSRGNVQPLLAVSWDNVTRAVWRFSLRRGVRFHDGQEMTSADVKFTLDRVLNPVTKAPWRPRISAITQVDATDRYTVTIRTGEYFATLVKNLSIFGVLPKHLYDQRGPDRFLDAPVGTGPFRFSQWQRDQAITLSRNDGYWGVRPRIGALQFRQVPEAGARVAGLLAGEVDVVYALPVEQISTVEGRGFRVVTANIGQSMTIPIASGRGGPLNDPRVRLAIHHSVDVDAIIRSVWAGRARKLDGQIVGPDGFGYNPQVKAVPYDVPRARQLLSEAGHPNGLEVQLDLPPNYYEKDTEMFNIVQAQAAQAGIRIRANVIDRGRRLDRLYGGTLGPMFFIAWQYLPAMDAELPLSLLHSTSQMKLFSNNKFDELLDLSRATVDQEQRLRILREIMVLLRNDPPMIYMYQVPASFGLNSSVENFRPSGDWGFDFSAVSKRR